MKTRNAQDNQAEATWTREKVKRYLVQRFYTRFHMSLILSSSGLAAMLTSWALLHGGVHAMWLRYPVAVVMAYLTFLAGVSLWLKYVGLDRRSGTAESLLENADVPDVSIGGGGGIADLPGGVARGGGQFGGGGAGGAWAEGSPVQAFTSGVRSSAGSTASSSGSAPGIGGKLVGGFADLDGDALVLLLLALLLIASIFLLSGYVIWFAPDILGEAAFGAVLAGGLVKPAKRQDGEGWIAGVVKKTWWPFAIVLVLALVFATYAAVRYPAARTFGQAVVMAVQG
jgi:hypothetical protein